MKASHVAPLLLALSAVTVTEQASAAPQRVGCIWDRLADSPIPRFEPGTVPIDGKLYCFGGFFTQQIQATARVDAYDPLTNTWTQKADLPRPTTHIGVIREGRNVWVLGGFDGDNPAPATSDVWIYNIDTDSWSAGPSLPRPIAGGGAAFLGTEVHYYGGCEADRDTVTGDHWAFDLAAPGLGWQPRAPMPEPRCHLAGAALAGELWAVGGQYNHDTNPTDTRWVHVYTPGTDSWRLGPLLPERRSHFEPGTFVDSGHLYIAGGKDLTTGRETLAGMLELDPVLGEWSYLPPLPNPRYGAGVQKIGSDLYAVSGAAPFNNPQADLYRRDWAATFPNPLYINCGGPEVVSSTGTCCWCGDIGFESGATAFFNPNADVLGTDEDEVFDRMREGNFPLYRDVNYRLPMGNGFYRVRFHLAERALGNPGQRVLDLSVEGTRLAENIDLIASVGFQTAFEKGFDVEVTDGVLNINIHAAPNQRAIVAGLEIERLGPDHFESECSNSANSTGSPSLVGFVGSTSIGDDDLTLTAGPLPLNAFGFFIQATQAGSGALAGGTLCVQQPFYRLPAEQALGGVLRHRLQIQNPNTPAQQILAGSTWRFQAWHRDTVAVGYGLSNALKLVFTP
ncbi:N-acetylneuraminate epimerase [Planctomycetes bacterium Poly30]|uniref:N-acetylneuraminate epimerase n=1 Tax=Saltatorellus ferox TaxID=2528018 RepID=A0A518F0P3_9BACT|nr:N-acetylneuraminate epimerase [Planctomycetes bacterium Poly30]